MILITAPSDRVAGVVGLASGIVLWFVADVVAHGFIIKLWARKEKGIVGIVSNQDTISIRTTLKERPMSQTKFPVVRIRAKDPTRPPTGSNVTVELDGKPLNTAFFVKAQLHSRRVTKVLIEMYAHVDMDLPAVVEVDQPESEPQSS